MLAANADGVHRLMRGDGDVLLSRCCGTNQRGSGGSRIVRVGSVFQGMGRVLVEVDVSGLPEDGGTGFFPLHIHEGGSCGGDGFSDTESHYDLAGKPHPEHAGDLPPLLCCGPIWRFGRIGSA